MAGVVWRTNVEQVQWNVPGGPDCKSWHLLNQSELSVKEEHMPVWSRERRHYHVHARQFFYVLAGELTLELKGKMHNVASGRGIEVAPGMLHQALNRGSAETRFLVISQPSVEDDRIDA